MNEPIIQESQEDQASAPAFPDERPWPMFRPVLLEAFQIVAPALVLALIVHLFLAQATVVFGQSMEPNLHPHQRLIVDKISYRLHPPRRNDIVVIDLPHIDELLVKRIVALPGETVEIRQGVIYVNGEALAEPFPHDMTPFDMAPITLGPLSYFVLGDNRSNSNDSRAFGPVTLDRILGRVWLRYWPLDQITFF
ncbi:MAG: signal peptidase I [Caldilinea sp.]|nr:signal peptidase I [Caldilinea sp.]MDW8440759.1 signal peptidase I [Caldilineaceae bacterium]